MHKYQFCLGHRLSSRLNDASPPFPSCGAAVVRGIKSRPAAIVATAVGFISALGVNIAVAVAFGALAGIAAAVAAAAFLATGAV